MFFCLDEFTLVLAALQSPSFDSEVLKTKPRFGSCLNQHETPYTTSRADFTVFRLIKLTLQILYPSFHLQLLGPRASQYDLGISERCR